MLPFDAVWENRRLIVEVDERQHGEPVSFFDKPHCLTVSEVHRGEQRRLYDARKVQLAKAHGYSVVRVPVAVLAWRGHRLCNHRSRDLAALRTYISAAGVDVDRA